MNTLITRFRSLCPCALDKSSLSIGRVTFKNILGCTSIPSYPGYFTATACVHGCGFECTSGMEKLPGT